MINEASNVTSVRIKVFLEGIEVPYERVTINYSLSALPLCDIVLLGDATLRTLPEDTKVLVVYQEPFSLPDSDWYVLFDGEIGSTAYAITATGTTLTISAGHSSGYLDLLPLIVQPVTALSNGITNDLLGGGVPSFTSNGLAITDLILGNIIFGEKGIKSKIKSAADFVFGIIRGILKKEKDESKDIKTTAFFRKKILDEYKLTDRMTCCTLEDSDVDTVASSIDTSIT